MKTLIPLLAMLALMCLAPPVHSGPAPCKPQRYPALTSYGSTYVNTCSAQGHSALRKHVFAFKIADRAQLWKLIDALLCADRTPAAERLIASSMTRTVIDRSEGTAQDPLLQVIERDRQTAGALLASRRAWDASVAIDRDGVTINYRSDEVCISGRTFVYAKASWRITASGQACD